MFWLINSKPVNRLWPLLCIVLIAMAASAFGAGGDSLAAADFPPPLESYGDASMTSLWEVLQHRVKVQPFNLVATLLFLAAIIHTFLTHKFRHWAHLLEERHQRSGAEGGSVAGRALHFLGEVEAVFGIWVAPLLLVMAWRIGPTEVINYTHHRVSYIEPIFVVVIMSISATRPILTLAESLMRRVAAIGGEGPAAWWFTILTLGPLLGSLITEPAAMTISASLLARQFYRLRPRAMFAYATVGLLFVNISVGGTLTHFAAPPVLMVAGRWGWDSLFMLKNFGVEAAVGILISNALYFLIFRKDFKALNATAAKETGDTAKAKRPLPVGMIISHILLLVWTVWNAHHPVFLVGGFLFFIAFYEATQHFQDRLELRSPILVGFFLAGLVIHGGLQQWWIEPVIRSLSAFPLFVGATILTAFNDNAAITYLATLVPDMTDAMKLAVVAGAVTGGGLTVIANAPNPAGQAILNRFFKDGISPLGLLLGALAPTIIVGAAFMLLR